jgi:ribosome-associated protein
MVKQAKAPKTRQIADDELTMEDVLAIVSRAVDEKKGENLRILDVREQLDYLDYMVVCSGYTEMHNRAIADSVVEALSSYDIIPDALDGHRFGDWILIDYGVLVVHVFLPALRDFYRLEELWAAGKEVVLR